MNVKSILASWFLAVTEAHAQTHAQPHAQAHLHFILCTPPVDTVMHHACGVSDVGSASAAKKTGSFQAQEENVYLDRIETYFTEVDEARYLLRWRR